MNDPVLVLEFAGKGKKRGEQDKSEEDEAKKDALVLAASKVRKAFEGKDDQKLALALMDFQALCQSMSYDEEEVEEEE